MKDGNGTVTYEVAVGAGKAVVKTVRGRITAKRVAISTRVWDLAGQRVSAFRSGAMPMRLLAYALDGRAPVEIAKPTEKK